MSFPSFAAHGFTVTLVYREVTGKDGFGNDVYTETTVDVNQCSVQPASSRENLSFADQLTDSIVVFVPFGTPVDYIDAVLWNGNKYEVNGGPNVWQSPWTGNTAPVRVDATLVSGAG